jgi:hypothetical protein
VREDTVPDVTLSVQPVEAAMPRRPSKSERRAARFDALKAGARTGRELLDIAWDRLLAETVALSAVDPDKADRACRKLAPQIEAIALDTAREVARHADVTV